MNLRTVKWDDKTQSAELLEMFISVCLWLCIIQHRTVLMISLLNSRQPSTTRHKSSQH